MANMTFKHALLVLFLLSFFTLLTYLFAVSSGDNAFLRAGEGISADSSVAPAFSDMAYSIEPKSTLHRVLITGGAGFVGMHTAERLKKMGHHVVAYDILNDYYDPALKEARVKRLKQAGVTFIKGDVCDAAALEKAVSENKIDRIVHLAAQAGVRYSLKHPFTYTRNNIDCFVTIFEMLKDHPHIKFVYASSSSVYGLNDKVPFSETDPVVKPASLYAATKRSNELIAHVYHNLYGIASIGLRFFTVYGPWGRPDMAYFSFTDKILRGVPIQMYNHGNMMRDFTFIDDIVSGIEACLFVAPRGPQILNLGNNKPVHLKRFIQVIEDAIGTKAIIESVENQKGDVPKTYADIAKAQLLLGYSPSTPLETGIPIFVKWFRDWSGEK